MTSDEKLIEDLRGLAAACYMMFGVLVHEGVDIPLRWLDALSAAANNKPFDADSLLPFEVPAIRFGRIYEGECATNELPPKAASPESEGGR